MYTYHVLYSLYYCTLVCTRSHYLLIKRKSNFKVLIKQTLILLVNLQSL